MKKLSFLLAMVSMLATACSSGDGIDDEIPADKIPTDKIVVSPSTITVSAEANKHIATVYSPCTWRAMTEQEWIDIETELGIDGKQQLIFAVKDHFETSERQGKIVVSNSDEGFSANLTVVQKAFEPEWNVKTESLNFASEGGTQEIVIEANFTDYTYTANVNWLSFKKSEAGVNVTAKASDTTEERSAEVTISSEKYNLSKVVNVSQGAFEPSLTVEPKSLDFPAEGGTKEFTVTTNFDYDVTTYADWLTLERKGNVVTVKAIATDEAFDARQAEIVISSKQYNFEKSIDVSQQPLNEDSPHVIFHTTSNGEHIEAIGKYFGANIIGYYMIVYGTSRTRVHYICFDAPVTRIGDRAFISSEYYNTNNLTSIKIPNSVTYIGEEAFSDCSSLTSIVIPNGVKSIAKRAFYNCSGATSITIPNSVTQIGENAFYNCSGELTIDSPLVEREAGVPEAITHIEPDWQKGFTFTKVTIGDNVTKIGYMAFYNRDNLTDVIIGDGVTSIGDRAFYKSSGAMNVTIGNSVTSIGANAFRIVKDVYCKPTTPPTIYTNTFSAVNGPKIYVPSESVEAYKSAEGWSKFASYIEGYDF